MSENKPTIFYVYDALCGWSYGFTPVINAFYENHKEDYNFRVLSGGMVTGDRIGSISEVASFIIEGHVNIQDRTGIKFGEPFLQKLYNESSEVFTSVPPAMALALFRTQQPENELAFATRMQNAIYYEGMPPADWNTYGKCASEFGLNANDFAEKLQNQKLLQLTQQEFQVVSNWGIKGFPTVVLQKGEKAYVITRGYSSIDEMEDVLDKIQLEIQND